MIADVVLRGDTAIDYEIKATAIVPIKLFGTIRVFNIDVPIEKSGVYLLKIPVGKPQARFINAYWSPEVVTIGSSTTYT